MPAGPEVVKHEVGIKNMSESFLHQLTHVKKDQTRDLSGVIINQVRARFRANMGEADTAKALAMVELGEGEYEALARIINGVPES